MSGHAWKPLKPKPVHMAKMVSPDGDVSPLCAKKPRVIDLRRATWTIRPDAVTCPRCIAAATPRSPSAPPDGSGR